jgi:hypothetical protein
METSPFKSIIFSPHAREKMLDRGAAESEVEATIRKSAPEPARKGRMIFRKNFPFNDYWRGKHFTIK